MRISVTEAKAQLTEVVRRAEAGEEIVSRATGRRAARLVPISGRAGPRSLGGRCSKPCANRRGSRRRRSTSAARVPGLVYGEDGLPEMIAVDTSALMAILLCGAGSGGCSAVLKAEPHVLISAGAMAEALIVAARRDLRDEMRTLIEDLAFEVVSVTPAAARRDRGGL